MVISQRLGLIWAASVAATVLSYLLSHKEFSVHHEMTVVIMVIAAFKARLVILHFMGLKRAPVKWRLVFEGWVYVCSVMIVAIVLFS